jgi:hypothetical protein
MPKEKKLQNGKKKGLTDGELIEKYGDLESPMFPDLINAMLVTPSPNAPKKVSKHSLS